MPRLESIKEDQLEVRNKGLEASDDSNLFQVVLTDGTTLIGRLRVDHHSARTVTLLAPSSLISIEIPVTQIAGIRSLLWSVPTERVSGMQRRGHQELREIAFRSSIEAAADVGLKVSQRAHASPLKKAIRVQWGAIKFSHFEPLYCDWDHLSRMNGGLRSLGISTPFGGVSVGTQPSLWSRLERLLREASVFDLSEVSTAAADDIALVGSISFFEKPASLEMEGDKWEVAALSRSWRPSRRSLGEADWLPICLAPRHFMFPRNLWESIANPITFLGSKLQIPLEAMPQKIGPAVGKNYLLKVRAAACML